jgi:hypothetical protein
VEREGVERQVVATYAVATTVSVEKTIGDIRAELLRFGADAVATYEKDSTFAVAFEHRGYHVRLGIAVPPPDDRHYLYTKTRLRRTTVQARAAYEQERRSRMRALYLVIKAKLVAVQEGVMSFEEEFLAHILTPGAVTVAERLLPELQEIAMGDVVPSLMPGARVIALPPGVA